MHDYQERVIQEKKALDEKIDNLYPFLDTQVFADLVPLDQELLCDQLGHMRAYASVLAARIARFTQ